MSTAPVIRRFGAGPIRLHITVTEDLQKRLKVAAAEAGVSVSDYIRQSVEYVLAENGHGPGTAVPDDAASEGTGSEH